MASSVAPCRDDTDAPGSPRASAVTLLGVAFDCAAAAASCCRVASNSLRSSIVSIRERTTSVRISSSMDFNSIICFCKASKLSSVRSVLDGAVNLPVFWPRHGVPVMRTAAAIKTLAVPGRRFRRRIAHPLLRKNLWRQVHLAEIQFDKTGSPETGIGRTSLNTVFPAPVLSREALPP